MANIVISEKWFMASRKEAKNHMERILQSLDKDAHGCGTGGGRNNAEVFCLAGLTVLTSKMQMAPNKMMDHLRKFSDQEEF
ncbi:hypothetical protein AB1E19_007033 [Capra hircus]